MKYAPVKADFSRRELTMLIWRS